MSAVIPAMRRDLPGEGAFAHAGLVLDKYLRAHDDSSSGERELLRTTQKALQNSLNGKDEAPYQLAFARRKERLGRAGAVAFELSTPPGVRLVVGLGGESPLKTGLTLHRTYGVPMIPGSALKGLAAHYCVALAERPQLTKGGNQYNLLFGDQEDAGFIVFHDAWMIPDGVPEHNGIFLDVMTPHHRAYYGRQRYNIERDPTHEFHGKIMPPTTFDDPVPVTFLSVHAGFHFGLSWNGGAVDGQEEKGDRSQVKWLAWARDLLIAALQDWGVGAKTNSGYGRLLTKEAIAASSPKPTSPNYDKGMHISVRCIVAAQGKKKPKFEAADGFTGHIPVDPQPDVREGDELQLWVVYSTDQFYVLSTTEPKTKTPKKK